MNLITKKYSQQKQKQILCRVNYNSSHISIIQSLRGYG